MQLEDPLGQGKPEPGALGLLGMPGALLEGVEDALTVLGRHTLRHVHNSFSALRCGEGIGKAAKSVPETHVKDGERVSQATEWTRSVIR